MQRKKIRIYSDFDGTLTGAAGQKTWDVIKPIDIQTTADKTVRELMLKERLDNNEPCHRITPAALAFINEVTSNDDIELVIVSRNYERYILSVLKYHGLSDDTISKIKIYDRISIKDTNNKGSAVSAHENKYGHAISTFVIDDSKEDGVSMEKACSACENFHAQANEFNWQAIRDNMLDYRHVLISKLKGHLSIVQAQRFRIDVAKHQHKINVLTYAISVLIHDGSCTDLEGVLKQNPKWNKATARSRTEDIINEVKSYLNNKEESKNDNHQKDDLFLL